MAAKAKVKMLVSMAGPDESWVPGDEREVDETIAAAWAEAGIAERVEAAKPKREAATRAKREKAAAPKAESR